MLTVTQTNILWGVLFASACFLFLPILVALGRWIVQLLSHRVRKKREPGKRLLIFSGFLLACVWGLRFAVGYYDILTAKAGVATLTGWEAIFDSFVHALKTFSMDEDYVHYILRGKEMMATLSGNDTCVAVYGVLAAILNAAAPVAGGAVILEVLVSVFPRLRLWAARFSPWRETYYFSELNECSIALARSIHRDRRTGLRRPILIFTDAYADGGDEKRSEWLAEAKLLGAICVRDDLENIPKSRWGHKKYFLIDEVEISNLQALTELAGPENVPYLKRAEIYLFVEGDVYAYVETQVRERLRKEGGVDDPNMPVIVPVQSYRNLIVNLLDELPLYEPLIHKKRGRDGTVDLNVTILGTGIIGTEMFLTTYWCGQMLDCRLHIRIVSRESESSFWNRINYINPEIRHTTQRGDPILAVDAKGHPAEPYCTVEYIESNVQATPLFGEGEDALLSTDYFLVSLGSDAENLAVADKLRSRLGEHHLSAADTTKTVIAYVIYDTQLCQALNTHSKNEEGRIGRTVHMQAMGSLDSVYSLSNVFMEDKENDGKEAYHSAESRRDRARTYRERVENNYKFWSRLARWHHTRYKVFSLGLITTSIFDTDGPDDPLYRNAYRDACVAYNARIHGPEHDLTAMHRLAWLEHRRWCAYMRIKGFRHTDQYAQYYAHEGTHKHLNLMLHPCLVECDERGIRASFDGEGNLLSETAFRQKDKRGLDRLDILSYEMHAAGYITSDFKKYDYPRPIAIPQEAEAAPLTQGRKKCTMKKKTRKG